MSERTENALWFLGCCIGSIFGWINLGADHHRSEYMVLATGACLIGAVYFAAMWALANQAPNR